MHETSSPIALTIGDPAGIGPEITASVMNRGFLKKGAAYIIGQPSSLMRLLLPEVSAQAEVISAEDALRRNTGKKYLIVDTGGNDRGELPPGPSARGGRISGRSVETAIDFARRGKVRGIVTGPISKKALSLAGYTYRGHTDMLADMFDSPRCQMIMVNGELRVVIMTRDIPLKDVPRAVTAERIISAVKVTAEGLRLNWSITQPTIAVSALNPHAGDGGLLGREEQDIIIPALEKLRAEGLDVTGPVPADTLFYRWKDKSMHACVAMYHDQGMIPFKTMGFERGVNMTMGLPVVRTSVCHGTAYDLAGSGEANPGSLEAALKLAAECIERRRSRA
ncbi:MAG: 4-hydroxythreonine-4-phosphate dehydrogenase PdxA [Candidatus Latescibacteria bacterium]|nr:4-hydroxythreonine-4-phosphate dehydrogenase PdxA [bacterium]MBD3422915.1 4-hydroxythreonine-4-phosphate dehydrogenase PdxA [Candidatus Latescibacterota bacterium]